METHRYVRKNLVTSNYIDRYDLNAGKTNSAFDSTEYWTNGKTTLLSIPARKPSRATADTFSTSSYTMPSSPVAVAQNSSKTGSTLKKTTNTSNAIRNSLIAGSAAGMVSTIACHPFDVLRVKIQSTALAATGPGVTGTFRHTVQYGGFRALYTGLALPLSAQALYKGTVFTVNNITQNAISEWKTQENYKLGNFTSYKVTMADRFLCGFMGGAVNGALFVTPVEFIRNQLIAQQGSDVGQSNLRGPMSVIGRTMRSEGMTGLWRGMTTTVLRDSFGCGCFFVAMASTQEFLSPNEPPSSSVVVASGVAAGVAFWVWALPIDTMKTWIQSGTARNLSHAIELSQANGIRSSISTLFGGWQVAYGRGAPSAAITVTTYSFVQRFLEREWNT